MKLLVVTQKIDERDPILGFFVRWVEQLAERYEHVFVICLELGECDVPDNVTVHSLGKEQLVHHKSKFKHLLHRIRYIALFYFYLLKHIGKYNTVFVHMNQEYVLLGAPIWRLTGKRVGLWYNHTNGSLLTKCAMRLSYVVFHTSPYAYTANTHKSRRMPAGIDTAHFTPDAAEERSEGTILFVGRIAPIKRPDVLIAACRQLTERGITYALHIYGSARPEDEQYEERCRKAAEGLPVTFHGSIENGKLPPIYASSDIFVNLTPAGNYDKTVLEAMSCGTVVVASSEAFADIIAGEHRPTEADATALAQVLEQLIKMAHPRKADLREQYRKYVHDQHSLDRWAHEVTQNLDMLL